MVAFAKTEALPDKRRGWLSRLVGANSLALRLFLSATAWIVVILVATGIVLSSLYRHSVERAFDPGSASI